MSVIAITRGNMGLNGVGSEVGGVNTIVLEQRLGVDVNSEAFIDLHGLPPSLLR